jgi:hypothetical protein
MEYIAKMLLQAIETLAEEVYFRNTYSGRGMYGKTCVGITGSKSDCMLIIGSVIKEAAKASTHADDVDYKEVVDTLLDFEQDSMGCSVIIYWRQLDSLPAEKSSEEE